ncbi:hypothetical protein [Sulfurimonas diazotrophicus]|uniref:DUF481 domain-containing protein n=1 Tax=Sulfurimonas diazotrophicus TaxID=3131939 RepID=A0ABZ3HEP5_9BACT
MKKPGPVYLFFLFLLAVSLSAQVEPPAFPSVFDGPVPECNCSALVNEVNVHRALNVTDWKMYLLEEQGWFESSMEYIDAFHADVTQKVHVFSANADQKLSSWGGRETKKKRRRVPRDGNASEGLSDYFDELFHDDTYLYKGERSYLILRGGAEYNKEEGWKFLNNIRFAMKLPHTQEQLQIFVGDPLADKDKDVISENGQINETTGVGARYFLPDFLRDVKASVSAGFRGLTNPFTQGRIEYRMNFYDWLIRPVQYVDYSVKRLFYEETDLYFDRRISKEELVRLQLQRSTETEREGMAYMTSLSYFNSLGFRAGFRTFVSASGRTVVDNPQSADTNVTTVEMTPGIYRYSIGLGWKQAFARRWIFYEIIPRIDYDMQYDWQPNYVCQFWLELYFGDT